MQDLLVMLTFVPSSLDRISKDFGPVRVDVLGKIAEAVLGGLTYLYDTHKIMHRDIKPSNVLVNSKGQIKLCDFGVSGELINSVAATFVGTSTYMAPERISGAASYTVRSDVWSVGLMLMELAIGEFPFRGDDAEDEEEGEGGANEPMTILALLQRIVNEPAPKLPDSDAFPHMLDEMIAKCLIKVPEQRPTPQELLDHDQFIQASKRTPVDIREWAIGLMERNNRRSHLLPQMTPASRDALRTGMMPAIAEQGASRNGPAPSGVSKVGSSNPQNHQPTPPPSSRESRTAQSSSSGSRGLPSGGSQRHVMPQPPSVSTHTVPASTAAYDYGATQSAIDPAISRPYPPRSTSSSNLRSTPLTTHPSEFRSTPFTTHKDEAPAAQSSKPMPDYATDYRQHPAFQSGGADNDRGQRERSTARSTSSANSDSLPLQYMDSASSPPNQKGDPLPTPPESGRSRPGVGPQNHRAMTEEEAMVRGAARLNLNGDQSDWQHY